MEIVAADIGGTHARFAVADVLGGKVVALGAETVIKTAAHASLQLAWEAFAAMLGPPLPRAAAIAVAGPTGGEILKLTNNPWIIRPASLAADLGVDTVTLCNDFVAVGHAVAGLDDASFTHLCGPDRPLPSTGVTSIIGPGTGLGVAQLIRDVGVAGNGSYRVVATEGGHVDFAPLDSIDDLILKRLRARFNRVSVERVVAGPGLADIHAVLATLEHRAILHDDDKILWTAALAGTDSLAVAALGRMCLSLGSVAGDIALTHGAGAVVIAGGLGLRLAGHLPTSGFRQRFVAKGRFEGMMAATPVRVLTHPQPGLYGAAAAFAQEHDT